MPLDKRSGKSLRFSDPEVCKYALAGLCPYGLFKNTRSDLGAHSTTVADGGLLQSRLAAVTVFSARCPLCLCLGCWMERWMGGSCAGQGARHTYCCLSALTFDKGLDMGGASVLQTAAD